MVAVVVVVHGFIHLLGAAKGFGWADVALLKMPIGAGMGVVWLAAAVLLILAGALLALGGRSWPVVAAVAVVISQVVIVSSWGDAKAGTAANVLLLTAVVYGVASQGPRSYRARYRRAVVTALAGSVANAGVGVTEPDLAHLPDAVAAYLRQSGTVGRPRVINFNARIHGRIRAGANTSWMPFTGEQVNTYGPEPSRLFLMDANKSGLPVEVLHMFAGRSATMRVKVCSLIPIVNAAGPRMDRGESVTIFNDLCVLAPAALLDAPVVWQPVGDHHVRGTFTHGPHTVTAELTFNDDHELVDFVSDDRFRASPDGRTFTSQRWSTPICGYRNVDSRRLGTNGEGRWHAPEPEGEFAYLEFHLDEITYNAGTVASAIPEARYVSNPRALHMSPTMTNQSGLGGHDVRKSGSSMSRDSSDSGKKPISEGTLLRLSKELKLLVR